MDHNKSQINRYINNRPAASPVACELDAEICPGQVTILVNNAGMVTGKLLMDIPDKLIEKTFEVNTLAPLLGEWICHVHDVS